MVNEEPRRKCQKLSPMGKLGMEKNMSNKFGHLWD